MKVRFTTWFGLTKDRIRNNHTGEHFSVKLTVFGFCIIGFTVFNKELGGGVFLTVFNCEFGITPKTNELINP